MSKECMYCKHHDIVADSNNELRWICTMVESRNFFTETDIYDSCEEFQPEPGTEY
ncbi:MAG: hypothetical protein Q4D16_19670 [Eubacteriales bacterium]|nr:hypothetical protein [Eubacteriales bacterium]